MFGSVPPGCTKPPHTDIELNQLLAQIISHSRHFVLCFQLISHLSRAVAAYFSNASIISAEKPATNSCRFGADDHIQSAAHHASLDWSPKGCERARRVQHFLL